MPNPFTEHPAAVGETYAEHARVAGSVGLRMVAGGLACLVHALFPFLFVTTGSRAILALHAKVTGGRRRERAEGILAELRTAGDVAD